MPDNNELPPILQTFGHDLDVAMQAADSASSPGAHLVRTVAALPRRAPRRFALLAAAAAAVVALIVVPSFGGPRTAIAQAEVLKRAAAALEQPNAILYIQVQDYNSYGQGLMFPIGGNEPGYGTSMCIPSPCARSAPATAQSGIRADPANDTLTFSFQAWLSPDRTRAHTIYNNGDETALNRTTDEYSVYDAPDNTLTTLTDMGYPSTPPPPPSTAASSLQLASGGTIAGDFANPSFYEQLYQDVQAGDQTTISGGGQSQTVTSQLVGQTTIGSKSVYELRFDVSTTITAPSGGYSSLPAAACTATTCTLVQRQVLLYLDSQTYTPVRTVVITLNPHDIQGSPPGTTVTAVADYSIQALPDTPANEALVEMTAHSGATQVQATLAQYKAANGLDLLPSPGPGSTTNTGPTGQTGATSSTGPTGAASQTGAT